MYIRARPRLWYFFEPLLQRCTNDRIRKQTVVVTHVFPHFMRSSAHALIEERTGPLVVVVELESAHAAAAATTINRGTVLAPAH